MLTTRQVGASPLRYRKPARAQAARVPRKLALESLEDRTVPVLLANQLGAPILPGLTTTFSESVPPSLLSAETIANSSAGNEAVVPSTTGVLAPGAVPPPTGFEHVCPPEGTTEPDADDVDEAPEKVLLFHRTRSQTNPWVLIDVSENAVPAHLRIGDIIARDVTGPAGVRDNMIDDLDRIALQAMPENQPGNQKVILCHRTLSDTNPWVVIDVSVNALPAHLAIGDHVAQDVNADGVIDEADCLIEHPICPSDTDSDTEPPPGEGTPPGGAPGENQHPQKVLLWHSTSSATNPWVLIDISVNAMDTHLANGDMLAVDLVGSPTGGPDGVIDYRDLAALLGNPALATGRPISLAGDGDLLTALDRRDLVVAGAGVGGGPLVRVLSADTGEVLFQGMAFDSNLRSGVSVAVGDVNGDGWPDVIVAAGRGGGPRVRVFDGLTGDQLAGPLGSFFAFAPSFTGGVNVAAADVNGDGTADIIVAAGPGGGPQVEVLSGVDGSVLASFFAYAPSFSGGVTVAARLTTTAGSRRSPTRAPLPRGRGIQATGPARSGACPVQEATPTARPKVAGSSRTASMAWAVSAREME